MKRKELTKDIKLIKKCRKILIDLYSNDINMFIDLFFYENPVKSENENFKILEQAGILREENNQCFANVMVFPFRGKLIVTDFLLSLYKKKNGKFTRGLDDVWVMFPHETLLFIERLDNIRGKIALDMASGSGAISLFLAERFEKVIALDINPKAVKYARFNAVLNNLENKITNIQSDLFSEFKDIKFDYICWNGPTVALPKVKEPEKVYPLYTYGGPDGAEFTKRFLDEVFTHVNRKFKIKWWDGSLGDSNQSVVEQYIRDNFSKSPIKVTIEFLNKRRGVPLKEYDKLYVKYCLNKFDLSQDKNEE
ncbi:MAG TPA: methyltransferase [Patescibacteria group bacterium]|jgi:HemK-related putative methylase|nr:methyltransferase [Patescibacteria group bacterium]